MNESQSLDCILVRKDEIAGLGALLNGGSGMDHLIRGRG